MLKEPGLGAPDNVIVNPNETSPAEKWSQQAEALKQEYVVRKEKLPLTGLSLTAINERLGTLMANKLMEVFNVAARVKRALMEAPEFSGLKDLGFGNYDLLSGKDQGGEDTLLSPPFQTKRGKMPLGYHGAEKGNFSPKDGTITVWQDKLRELSSWEVILKSSLRGELTEEDQVVLHETIHGFQFTSSDLEEIENGNWAQFSQKARETAEEYRDNSFFRALTEGQASLAVDFINPIKYPTVEKPGNLVSEKLAQGYNVPVPQAEAAVKSILDMKALGFNDKEIATILRETKFTWDDKNQQSLELQKIINERKKTNNFPANIDLAPAYEVYYWQSSLAKMKLMEMARSAVSEMILQTKKGSQEEREHDRPDISVIE